MPSKRTESSKNDPLEDNGTAVPYQTWNHWPVYWSAVWVGALAALAAVILFGMIGVAVGAPLVDNSDRVTDLKTIGFGALAFAVFAAFLAFVIGGWVAGKISGIQRSEPAMLHGAIVWLLLVPVLAVLSTVGGAGALTGWYAGLRGASADAPYERATPPHAHSTPEEVERFRQKEAEFERDMKKWQEDAPNVTRNTALGAITALLLGLIGGVVGGWMASGEPMTLTYYRTRPDGRKTLAESR